MTASVEMGTFITLYGALLAGLLGVYALGFKIMRDVNSKIDGHITDTTLHVDSEHPVRSVEVCVEREKTMGIQFETLKAGQDRIEKAIEKLQEKKDG